MWPENWRVWTLFLEIKGQWRRAGMDGAAYALDYNVLFTRIGHLGLTGQQREAMFYDVKHIEREALRSMSQET